MDEINVFNQVLTLRPRSRPPRRRRPTSPAAAEPVVIVLDDPQSRTVFAGSRRSTFTRQRDRHAASERINGGSGTPSSEAAMPGATASSYTLATATLADHGDRILGRRQQPAKQRDQPAGLAHGARRGQPRRSPCRSPKAAGPSTANLGNLGGYGAPSPSATTYPVFSTQVPGGPVRADRQRRLRSTSAVIADGQGGRAIDLTDAV